MIVEKPQRRSTPRLHCSGEASIYLSMEQPPEPATIADLSLSGCRLLLASACELQSGVYVELAFFVNGLPFRVGAQMRAPRSRTEFGFAFLTLSKRSRHRLQELIEELAEEQVGKSRGARGRQGGIELL